MTSPISHLAPDILVVRFSAIGDILLTTPLLRVIRAQYPGARVTFLTKEQYVPLLSDNPNVNEVHGIVEEDGVREIAGLIRSVRYSHLLDLHGNLRTLALRTIVRGPWRTYSKRRLERQVLIATKRDIYRDDTPMAERYFEAAKDLDVMPDGEPPDFYLSEDSESTAEEKIRSLGLGNAPAMVALSPGAAHPTKCWPVEGWVRLARRLLSTGAEVVVIGGPDDVDFAKAILDALRGLLEGDTEKRVKSTAGMLSLQESGAVIKRSAAVVSGDTGVMHMATAVGTPVVALFGPTVRRFGFFPYQAERSTVVELPLECRPCSSHGSDACPLQHHLCMREIQPDMVFATLTRTLAT